MALNAEGHKRKSARAERSKFRYPLRGSALGKGKSGYMVHNVFLARDVPQEVFYVIAGILDTVALKRMASRAHGCHREATRSVVGVASRFDALLGGTREGALSQGDLRRGQDHGLLEKDAFRNL